MTARFEDWPRVRVADGVLLSDPRGAAAGLVRIRRARAPRTLRAVLAEACACPGARLDAATAEVQAVVTDAAEHGVIARLRAAPGVTCEPDRLIAIVHGERAQIQLEGCCAAPAEAAGFERAFEALVRGTVTGEPPLRRRLFGYQPPRGWHGVRRACATVWLPPGCPREPGALAVYDATPVAATAARRTHALLAGPPAGA
ncbi:MAG: hypothetical protein H6709_25055, partial [Kofleriaceae bacterium]|nr:hypothetical protein [Kofleriaceae bacterium]